MLSNVFPWEYFAGPSKIVWKQGISALYCYDPLLEKMIVTKIPPRNVEEQGPSKISLKDVDREWFENRFFSNDFFLNEESYLLLQSEQADSNLMDFILSHLDSIGKKSIIFLFEKDNTFFQSLCRHPQIQGWKIKEPFFWHRQQFFNFLCDQMKIALSHPVREYLLESVKSEVHEIINALKILKLNTSATESLTVNDVKALIRPNRLDFFKLADYYAEKSFSRFYRELLKSDFLYEEYQGLLSFLQGHLIKIYDPRYTEDKNRLSRYDKKISSQRQHWKNKRELFIHLQRLAEMEIMAKKKDRFLRHKLRNLYLERSGGLQSL